MYSEKETDMTTIVVLCDQYGIEAFWKNGRRVYSHFVIFDHIENRRVMTRETLDNVPIFNRDYGTFYKRNLTFTKVLTSSSSINII